MKVKAVYINKPGEIATRLVDYPVKKDNEVLIKVDAAGFVVLTSVHFVALTHW